MPKSMQSVTDSLFPKKILSLFPRPGFWQYLLLLIPVTIIAYQAHFPVVMTFILAAAALVPLAHFLGEATEVISDKTGEHLSGIINATFGNAAELVIAIVAIKSGLIDIVKYSLVGSIIGNILLILGLSLFVGGIKFGNLRLSPVITGTTTIHLSMAAMCFVVPSVFAKEDSVLALNKYSVGIAVVLLLVYFVGVFYSMVNRENKEASQVIHEDIEATAPKWSLRTSLIVLISATVGLVYMSEILVHQIEPLVEATHIPPAFVGLIILPLVGNVAEHSVAVGTAMKNKINLSLAIAAESSVQIALFVSPVCVLIAGLFGQNFNLIFNKIELITLAMSIGGTWLVVHDNKSNWWEGFSLLSFYLIIAITAYFL
ncbi:MAG: calcium/proton exchanger [Candidatus Brocadia sp.]|nr:calcium/proton exchanger [Candidatus Brocadia sp.]MDG5996665.1 calcium/proton exchanger [Candidatus Brocadia sp.]